MPWWRGDVVLGSIAGMLCEGLEGFGGVDNCSWEVWVVACEGLFTGVAVIGEVCSGANGSPID